MGLESGSFLNDLVTTNPVGATDAKSEGDNHIRLLKTVLKNTFPGLAGRAWRKQTKGGNYTGIATDNMSLIEFTTTATLSLTAVGTLGNGWMCLVQANGGVVTVDPSGTEQVNGALTFTIKNNYMAVLISDGTAFWCLSFPMGEAGFEAGTRAFFQQTTAPTGWTKVTDAAYNDAAMRVVTGTVVTGGADAFSSHFGASKTTAGHALTTGQMPVHTHGVTDPTHKHDQTYDSRGGASAGLGFLGDISGPGATDPFADTGFAATGITIQNAGSGQTHSHDLNNFNIKYVDTILAQRN